MRVDRGLGMLRSGWPRIPPAAYDAGASANSLPGAVASRRRPTLAARSQAAIAMAEGSVAASGTPIQIAALRQRRAAGDRASNDGGILPDAEEKRRLSRPHEGNADEVEPIHDRARAVRLDREAEVVEGGWPRQP